MQSVRDGCKRFIFVANLIEDGLVGDRLAKVRQSRRPRPPSKAGPPVRAAMRGQDEECWIRRSVVGNHIHAANPDFDVRAYGCAELSDLLEEPGSFEVDRNTTLTRARAPRS